MQIQPVDQEGGLWQVSQCVPQAILDQIQAVDWSRLTGRPQQGQESYPRLCYDAALVCPQLDPYLSQRRDLIAAAVGSAIDPVVSTVFWVDEPGLDAWFQRPHLDNCRVHLVMQLYWSDHQDQAGTRFYHDSAGQEPRHTFPYRSNSGYLMRNGPKAWHQVSGPVRAPARVSSYTYWGITPGQR